MKDLSEIGYNPSNHELNNAIPDEVRTLVDGVFEQLAVIFPAWRQAWRGSTGEQTADTITRAKKEWVKAFFENHVNTIDMVKQGLQKARASESDFLPSCGKFVSWCKQPSESVNDSYYRFIRGGEPKCYAELLTRREVGYQCRTKLAEEKAIKLWGETINRITRQIQSGEIQQPGPQAKRIEAPPAEKPLTEEEKIIVLDRLVDEHVASGAGKYLIGPLRKRAKERGLI